MADAIVKDQGTGVPGGERGVSSEILERKDRTSSLTKKTKVIIAVDEEEPSMDAFQQYMQHMHKPENELIILHCGEMSNVSLRLMKGDQAPYAENWEKMWSDERAEWKGIRTKFLQEMREKQVRGKFEVVLSSNPGHAILQEAEKNEASMIVMGARNHGSIKRALLGSVSDYVIHHAHIPVVVCRQ